MKQRITVSLPENVHAWLKQEAEDRGLQPGTHAAQLLYDIMQGTHTPAATRAAPAQRAQHVTVRARQPSRPQDTKPLPLTPQEVEDATKMAYTLLDNKTRQKRAEVGDPVILKPPLLDMCREWFRDGPTAGESEKMMIEADHRDVFPTHPAECLDNSASVLLDKLENLATGADVHHNARERPLQELARRAWDYHRRQEDDI